jgi:hypothetical protein
LIVAGAIHALETSARFEDRIEATALFGDLAASPVMIFTRPPIYEGASSSVRRHNG